MVLGILNTLRVNVALVEKMTITDAAVASLKDRLSLHFRLWPTLLSHISHGDLSSSVQGFNFLSANLVEVGGGSQDPEGAGLKKDF